MTMPLQKFKLQMSLNYVVIPENRFFRRVFVALEAVKVNWFPVTHLLANLITNSIHVWLTNFC